MPVLEPLAPANARAAFPHGIVFACFMLCIASGSALFELAARRLDARQTVALTLAIATAALATPVSVESFGAVLCCFCVFEACCGAFGPGCATLRSRYARAPVPAAVARAKTWGVGARAAHGA